MLYPYSMSKSTKSGKRDAKRSPKGVVDRSATTDIVTQLECAARNPQAALLGALIGGIVPWFARTLAHDQVPAAWSAGHRSIAMLMIAVVLGCACFSAISVYKFGRAAFGDARKALGFVLALEGVMLVSTGATSVVALVVLIAINAIANGSVIALARDATKRRYEDDARRSATRSRNRNEARAARTSTATIAKDDAGPARRSRERRVAVDSRAGSIVRWSRATLDDVIDAEVVSEELLLS